MNGDDFCMSSSVYRPPMSGPRKRKVAERKPRMKQLGENGLEMADERRERQEAVKESMTESLKRRMEPTKVEDQWIPGHSVTVTVHVKEELVEELVLDGNLEEGEKYEAQEATGDDFCIFTSSFSAELANKSRMETDEQRAMRLARMAESRATKRAVETEEEKMIRLATITARNAKWRANESDEKKAERLAKQRLAQAMETEEKRANRLARMKIYNQRYAAKRRANQAMMDKHREDERKRREKMMAEETEEEREARLQVKRDKYWSNKLESLEPGEQKDEPSTSRLENEEGVEQTRTIDLDQKVEAVVQPEMTVNPTDSNEIVKMSAQQILEALFR